MCLHANVFSFGDRTLSRFLYAFQEKWDHSSFSSEKEGCFVVKLRNAKLSFGARKQAKIYFAVPMQKTIKHILWAIARAGPYVALSDTSV